MCAICGIVGITGSNAQASLLESMTQTMRHRGPNDEGYQRMTGAAFGFQRLSIIDLAGGHQPMSNEDDSLWIVFNGEIYNFEELRASIEATGRHRFKTRSDTEVILHLYEEYGDECVQHLRGMFAFAIWDTKRQRLFAARDRFGKKPFFYFQAPCGGVIFASELKALHRHPEAPKTIDLGAIQLYLSLQYIPAPRTIYKGIAKLPAAHTLSWNAAEGLQVKRYWDLRYEPTATLSYADAQDRLRTLLHEAVRLRMIADVPLGAFLSGGIDSSIIVALMAQQSSRPIQTFSIGFKEDAYSELGYAKQVAQKYGTNHHEFIVEPHLTDILPKLAWFYSEPFADASALPSYYVSRETRQHVTVALNGDGGDEIFGGYLRYRAMWAMQYWNHVPISLRKTLYRMSQALPASAVPIGAIARLQRLLQLGSVPAEDQYLRLLDYFHPEEIDELWQPDHRGALQKERASSQTLFNDTLAAYTPKGSLNQLLYLDLHHYLPDGLMVKMDIASMANSLETRSPLLDHVLAEEVARWPEDWKYRPPNASKRILRDTFACDLPPQILRRGKQGFGIPMGLWFRGPLKHYLRETLLSPHAMNRAYFEPHVVRRYVDEHLEGRKDWGYRLWALLMLELWHQAYPSP
jgi:asparagine synthase (glutamine-hydrolysing)